MSQSEKQTYDTLQEMLAWNFNKQNPDLKKVYQIYCGSKQKSTKIHGYTQLKKDLIQFWTSGKDLSCGQGYDLFEEIPRMAKSHFFPGWKNSDDGKKFLYAFWNGCHSWNDYNFVSKEWMRELYADK